MTCFVEPAMSRPGRAAPRLEPLEPRDTPALIGLEAADQLVAASAGYEQNVRIAMRPDGAGFVVVYDAPDGGAVGSEPDRGVYFRLYDADWNPVGGPVAANTVTTGKQDLPAVGMDAAGNFVVAWESLQQSSLTEPYEVWARRFTANGTPIDAAEFQVNTGSANDGLNHQYPAVGVNAAGRFVIAWSGGQPFSDDVSAKGYAGILSGPDGNPAVTFAESQVNVHGPGDTIRPAVAVAADGSFVVAYQSYNRDGGTTTVGSTTRPDYGVYVRRMNADGTPAAAEARANAVVNGDQQNADVAMDAAGNTVVVWDSPNPDGSGEDVVAQRYDSNGTPLGGNVTVNQITAGRQRAPRVARAGGGDYVVVWQGDEATAGGTDIYYRKFAASGDPLTGETVVNSTAADGTAQTQPAVGIDAAGDFVVPFTTAGASADAVLRRVAEAPVVTFTDAGDSAVEAVTDRPFTVTRQSNAPYVMATTTAVVVKQVGGDAAAVEDYSTALPLTLTFAPGDTTLTGHITVVDDNHYEENETLVLGIPANAAAYTLGNVGSRTVTIVNDDVAIGVAVAPAAVDEDSGTQLVYTFTRLGPSAGSLTVPFAVGGTGVVGTDYTAGFTAAGGSVTFGLGETTATVTVTPIVNANPQPDRDVVLTVTGGPGYEPLGTGTATGTILDDDTGVSVAVSPAGVDEGDGRDLVYTFTRIGDTTNARTVNVAVGGSAVYDPADGDYTVSSTAPFTFTATAATVTFPAGAASVVVRVTPRADGLYETDETVQLGVAPGAGYTVLAQDTAVGTIHNTDPLPTLSVGDVSCSEKDGTVTFTVTLTGATAVGATVQYATADGTAVAAGGNPGTPDYTARSNSLTFGPSTAATQTQTVTVSLVNDAVYEATEQFFLDLSAATDASIGTARGTATVADDDPVPTLAVNSVGVTEGTGNAAFTVTLTGATALPVTVHYAAADGTAVGGSDFTTTSGDLTFNPSAGGTQAQTVLVPVTNDSVYERTEQFFLDLSGAQNATVATARGTGTITDDDPLPTLSVGDVSVSEKDGSATFTVTLTGATAVGATVLYATADGTAVSGGTGPGQPDYTATSSTLTFAPGVTTRTVTVPLTNDLVHEADETFVLNLSGPTDAAVTRAQGTATVADDDPLPSLAVGGVTVSEGNGTATFTVTLTGATALPVTVHYATADGTAVSTGPGQPDFTAKSNDLTFAPSASGTQSQTVVVALTNDLVHELSEQFFLDLSAPTNATVGTARGVGTVTDDDPVPVVGLSLSGSPFAENGGVATVTATLSNTSVQAVTIDLAFAGTAAAGGYTASAAQIVIPAGATTGSITLTGVDDGVNAADQTVVVSIAGVTNGTAGSPASVTATRRDTDAPTAKADGYPVGGNTQFVVAAPGVLLNDEYAPGSVAEVVANPAHGTLVLAADGGFTYTPAAGFSGVDGFDYRVRNPAGLTATAHVTLTVSPPAGPSRSPLLVGGFADGSARVFAASGARGFAATPETVRPFGPLGVELRTATADVDGDLVPDLIFVTGPGTPIRVAVVSGADNRTVLVAPFDPFGGDFRGGGFVAAADLDRDGRAEFVVTPDQGGGPRVSVFSLAASGAVQTRANFFGIDDPNFRGGARAAVGDVNKDGTPDVVVAAGFGGGPRVAIFTGQSVLAGAPARLVGDFYAFPGTDAVTLRNGTFVAAGDVDGDGYADLVFGGGPGGAPRVFVLSGAKVAAGDVAGAQAAPVANFYVAGNDADRGGARVAVKPALSGGGVLAVGSGEGSPAAARYYTAPPAGGEPPGADVLDLGAVLAAGVFVG